MSKRSYAFRPPQIESPVGQKIVSEIGSKYLLTGLLFSGEGENLVLVFPDHAGEKVGGPVYFPPWEEWSEILRMSDDPVVKIKHAFIRKAEYVISGFVQQRIWKRDGYRCAYCNVEFGQAQITVDHFVPLELDGKNDDTNYISACRKCNKEKGSMAPESWCESKKLDYDMYVDYLAGDPQFQPPFPGPPF